jgi:hypothetical protein
MGVGYAMTILLSTKKQKRDIYLGWEGGVFFVAGDFFWVILFLQSVPCEL